jgi:hypothetical protein
MFLGNKRKAESPLNPMLSHNPWGGNQSIPFDKGFPSSGSNKTSSSRSDHRSPSNSFERQGHSEQKGQKQKNKSQLKDPNQPQQQPKNQNKKEYILPSVLPLNHNSAYQRPRCGETVKGYVEEFIKFPISFDGHLTNGSEKPQANDDVCIRKVAEQLKEANKHGLLNCSSPEIIDLILSKQSGTFTEEEKNKFFAIIPSNNEFVRIMDEIKKQKLFLSMEHKTHLRPDDSDEDAPLVLPEKKINKTKPAPIDLTEGDLIPPIQQMFKEIPNDKFVILFELEGKTHRINLKLVNNLLNTDIVKIHNIIPVEELGIPNIKSMLSETYVGQFDYFPEDNKDDTAAQDLYQQLSDDKLLHIKRAGDNYFLISCNNKYLKTRTRTNAEILLLNVKEDYVLIQLDVFYKKKEEEAFRNEIAKSAALNTVRDNNAFKYSTLKTDVDYEKLLKEKEDLEGKVKEKEEENKRDRANTKVFYEGMINSKKSEILRLQDELEKVKIERVKISNELSELKINSRDVVTNASKLTSELSQVKLEKARLDLRTRDEMDKLKLSIEEKDKLIEKLIRQNFEINEMRLALETEVKKLRQNHPSTTVIDEYEVIEEKPIICDENLKRQLHILEAFKERLLCILCNKNDRNLAFKDCRHVTYCSQCVKDYILKNPKVKIKGKDYCKVNVECPTCKKAGQDLMEVNIN